MKYLLLNFLALFLLSFQLSFAQKWEDPYMQHYLEVQDRETNRLENELKEIQQKVQTDTDKLENSMEVVGGAVAKRSATVKHIARTQIPQYLTEINGMKVKSGAARTLGKNAFSYALSMAGIGAGTSILKDYQQTGKVSMDHALDFLSDSEYLKTSAGIFVGATALSMLGHVLPPGVGAILKTAPGFLGAALGYEWGQGTLDKIDPVKMGVSVLASSAAFVALGSGGILAIGAGIAASMAAEALYDKITGKDKVEDPTELMPGVNFRSREEEGSLLDKVNPFSENAPLVKPDIKKNSGNNQKDPAQHKELLREIQNSAEDNQDPEETKRLLQMLDNFGSIR